MIRSPSAIGQRLPSTIVVAPPPSSTKRSALGVCRCGRADFARHEHLQAAVEVGGGVAAPDGVRIGEREHAAFRVLHAGDLDRLIDQRPQHLPLPMIGPRRIVCRLVGGRLPQWRHIGVPPCLADFVEPCCRVRLAHGSCCDPFNRCRGNIAILQRHKPSGLSLFASGCMLCRRAGPPRTWSTAYPPAHSRESGNPVRFAYVEAEPCVGGGGERYGVNSLARSFQSGLDRSISSSFQRLFHFLS